MRSSKSRSRSKSNRQRSLGNIVNRVFDSSGPEGKVRGTPQQIIDKYLMLARDAQLSNDRVAEQNFLQHAEHYTRMLGEAQREMAREQEMRPQNQQGGQNNPQHGGQNNGGQNNGGQNNGNQNSGGQISGHGGNQGGNQPRGERNGDRNADRDADRDEAGERSRDRFDQRGGRPPVEESGLTIVSDGDDGPELVDTPETRPQPDRAPAAEPAGAGPAREDAAAAPQGDAGAKPPRSRAPRRPKPRRSDEAAGDGEAAGGAPAETAADQ